jgi:hypothetical protein
MSPNERYIGPRSRPGEPCHPIALPPELADFLKKQDLTALFHAADIGTLLIVKVPAQELATLRGPLPIGLVHELYRHPRSPVIRTLLTFVDQPEAPLCVETFTNPGDPDQRASFAALADQAEIPLLFYDEALRHRLSKRVRNATADQIPAIVATADQLLAAIPPDRRDFDRAKADIMEATSL